MARYPNQDFQQNVSFKCNLEFRFALKLAMEKATSRDTSSFIRTALEPEFIRVLGPETMAQLRDLNSPLKIKEAARGYYREKGCLQNTQAIRQMLQSSLPIHERRVLEIGRVVSAYEHDASLASDDPKNSVLVRAALNTVASDLGKITRLLARPWSREIYSSASHVAAELPEDLGVDVGHGLDFLNDDQPSMLKPYVGKLDPATAWINVRSRFAEMRPLQATFIHDIEFHTFDGETLHVIVPKNNASRIETLNGARNQEVLKSLIREELGQEASIHFSVQA